MNWEPHGFILACPPRQKGLALRDADLDGAAAISSDPNCADLSRAGLNQH